nr:MAG TPA: endoribonuclease [Caudoviricetes sp.]
MKYEVLGVYLVDFQKNRGGELSGKHYYGLILSKMSDKDKTLLVAPMTSKKKGKKYKGGFTIDCTKYQQNPTYEKAFIKIRKIREIDIRRIYGTKKYTLDEEDTEKLRESMYQVFKFLK